MRYKKAIMNAVNRFPLVYKRQAFQMLGEAVSDGVHTTADAFKCAAMLTLIEDFGFGTDPRRASRLKKFYDGMCRRVDVGAMYYDDAVAHGLRDKLHALGVEYALYGEEKKDAEIH